ncbi:MAG: hypothetical protein ACLFTK_08150 [Anaerolineales bacterium]
MQRSLILFLLTILLLSLAAPVGAQDRSCGRLDEADCDILYDAIQDLIDAGSFSNKEFTLELGGAGAESAGNTALITGSGPMIVDQTGRITTAHLTGATTFEGETTPTREFMLIDDTVYLGEQDEFIGLDASSIEGRLLVDLATGTLLSQAFNVPNVATPTRLDDAEIDGETMLVFESTIDVVAFFSNEDIQALLVALLQSAVGEQALENFGMGEGGFGDLSEADLAGAVQLLPLLLTQDTLQVRQWVSEDETRIYRVELEVDWVLDATFIDPSIGQTELSVLFASDIDEHGADVVITAPDEFELVESIDPQELLEQLFPMPPANPGDDAQGPGDAVAAPNLTGNLAYGDTVTGELTARDDEHIYSFQAEAGDVITAAMTATQARMDPLLVLMDANGQELARNDDHTTERADLAPFDALIADYEIGEAGEYWLMATWPTALRDGGYALTLTRAASE